MYNEARVALYVSSAGVGGNPHNQINYQVQVPSAAQL